jgi:hypothetical protein
MAAGHDTSANMLSWVSDSQRIMFPYLCCLTPNSWVFIPHEATANSERRIGKQYRELFFTPLSNFEAQKTRPKSRVSGATVS